MTGSCHIGQPKPKIFPASGSFSHALSLPISLQNNPSSVLQYCRLILAVSNLTVIKNIFRSDALFEWMIKILGNNPLALHTQKANIWFYYHYYYFYLQKPFNSPFIKGKWLLRIYWNLLTHIYIHKTEMNKYNSQPVKYLFKIQYRQSFPIGLNSY